MMTASDEPSLNTTPALETSQPEETARRTAPRVFQSEELFAGQKEVLIIHGDAHYRLKITSAGRLVLNK